MFTRLGAFWTFAYYTNDLAANASNTALGTVSDQSLTRDSTGYFFPQDARLWAGYIGIPDGTAARLNSPSQRDPFLPYLAPISLTALPADIPPIFKPGEGGPQVFANEYTTLEASRGGAVVADSYAVLWAGVSRRPVPNGPRRKLRFTSATTVAEGSWALGSMTFAEALPTGHYSIVGLEVYGANVLAARLAFTGGGPRPGVLAQGAQGEWIPPAFSGDELGEFGTFLNTVQPQIEFFGTGAGAAQVGYLDLVKIG